MIGNKIENDSNATLMRFVQKGVEIGECPEHRINVAVVRDVVTEIRHRRRIDR